MHFKKSHPLEHKVLFSSIFWKFVHCAIKKLILRKLDAPSILLEVVVVVIVDAKRVAVIQVVVATIIILALQQIPWLEPLMENI
jgi:hypothetical protein